MYRENIRKQCIYGIFLHCEQVFWSQCQNSGQGNQPWPPQGAQQQQPQQQPQNQQQPQPQPQQQQPQQQLPQQQQPQQPQMQTPFNTQGQLPSAPSAGLPFLPQGGFPLPNGLQGAQPPTGYSNDPLSFAASLVSGIFQGLASIPNYLANAIPQFRPPNFRQ